ncbi:MAG: hypothetical protein QNM02_19515 [Acidimicrobiia bacterium]|nr:hypothetical protein [Acidimicrobiia bacterium]
MSRLLRAALLGVLLALALGSPAFADPAGPTDYRSEIIAVEPPTPAIVVEIIGGDSFLQLEAEPGTEVLVVGYQGEPYLRFLPEGGVLENRNAPTTYTNESRYGGDEIPPNASASAEPDWQLLSDGHRWAWHDHRIHWMQRDRPLGASSGDQILEAVVPLVVDGTEVKVTVISTWQPPPSPVPMWLGGLAGIALTAGLWLLRDRAGRLGLLIVPAALALVVGAWQFLSLPSETAPRVVWWLLPAIAAVCAVVALVAELRRRTFVARAAGLLVGVELALWGWMRRDGLSAAIIPSDAPGWLDRFTVALAIVGGVGVAATMLWEIFAPGFPRSEAEAAVDASAVPGG